MGRFLVRSEDAVGKSQFTASFLRLSAGSYLCSDMKTVLLSWCEEKQREKAVCSAFQAWLSQNGAQRVSF